MYEFDEKMNQKHRDIINYHFNDMEWNMQTTVYGMLAQLFIELDKEYLKDIADLYNKNGEINHITVQLECAILDVLKRKNLIKPKEIK